MNPEDFKGLENILDWGFFALITGVFILTRAYSCMHKDLNGQNNPNESSLMRNYENPERDYGVR